MTNTIRVTDAAELMQALAAATGGETIVLAAGNYGRLAMIDNATAEFDFASNVTIRSEDPAAPAVVTGLDMRGASNITLDGITFDYTFSSGDQIHHRPFSISGSQNVTIRNATFDGDVAEGVSAVDDGYGYAIGLSIRGSAGVTVEDSEFFGFHRGMTVSESSGVAVRGNDVHSMRMDGLNFVEVTGVVVENNHIHDFRGSLASSDHRDFIQFWTNGTDSPSTDIVIRGNILDIGEGDWAQSIFMRNEEVDWGAGPEMFYRNILIEDNVIVNGHLHGITVGQTAGLVIRNNSVLHDDGNRPDGADSSVEIPRIAVATTSTGVVITQNLTSGISGFTGQADWNVSDNGFVQDQDPNAPGYYGDVFISSSMQQHAFILLPGSVFDEAGIGAPGSQPENDLALVRFHVNGVEGDGASRVFDARFGAPEGTTFRWTFGDGSAAEGPLLRHSFTGGGAYDVTLTVTLPDGTEAAAVFTVAVAGPDVLRLAPDGSFVAYDMGSPVADMPGGTAEGVQLGAPGTTATVGRQNVVDIVRSDEVGIDFSLRADAAGAAGEVFRIHGSLVVSVTQAGELSVAATGGNGRGVTVTTQGANLGDMAAHDITIRLEEGRLTVSVDGEPAASATVTLPLTWTGSHDLVFGNPWGHTNFNGDLTAFSIRTDMSDYPDEPLTVPITDNGEPPQGGRVLLGGSGDDIFIIDYVTDLVDDAGGLDVAQSTTVSLDLRRSAFEDVEHATLTGQAALDATGDARDNRLTGNDGANRLEGNDGADSLTGGAGLDTLVGGAGNDAYRLDGEDIVIEVEGGGIDTLYSDGDTALGEHVEHLVLTGEAAADGTGNADDNRIIGNDAANVLRGGGGADTLDGGAGNDIYVTDGDDTVIDTGGTDMVRSSADIALADGIEILLLTGGAIRGDGNDLDNRITGNAQDNLLRGGSGADTLAGGAGDDSYVVEAVDTVVEAAGEGVDTVRTAGSFTLGANIEHLILTGDRDTDGSGNAAANMITGNSGDNVLDGAAGQDTLQGGRGNDTYVLGAGDTITEAAGEGFDTVHSSMSTRLAAHVERLILTGTADLQGLGNDLANRIIGNAGHNRLDGGAGQDTLQGGRGNDIYVLGAGDTVIEAAGEGFDTVNSNMSTRLVANVERLVLTGSADLQGLGNDLANRILGNAGDNSLSGLKGNDVMTGGAGEDVFVFRTGDGRDRVTDFDAQGVAHDVLDLRGLNAVTGFQDLMANHARQTSAGVMISAGSDSILLEGVRLADLDRGEFLF